MGKSFSTIVIILISIAAFLILGRYLLDNHALPTLSEYVASTTPPVASTTPSLLPIGTPHGTIRAFVADTPETLTQGLSGQTSLADDQGMLFLFPVAESYSFWMKDMNFPLDIIWINENKSVIGVAAKVATSTYPENFRPPSPVRSVLEINAGQAEEFGIATGTILVF